MAGEVTTTDSGIRITIDPAQLAAVKQKLLDHPKQLLKAVAGAINDTAKHEKVNISKLIRDRVNLSKAKVDDIIKVDPATPQKLKAVVTVKKTDRISLRSYGAKQTPSMPGTSVLINKADGRTMRMHAFIVNKLNGQVFLRAEKASGGQVARLPIKKQWGPSPWGVFEEAGGRIAAQKDAQAYLNNRITHRLLYQPVGDA